MSSFTFLTVCVVVVVLASFSSSSAYDIKPNGITAVKLSGTAVGVTRDITAYMNVTSANCFDVDILNVETEEVIGNGTDCLMVISNEYDVYGLGSAGMFVVGTTYFETEYGTIVSRGVTTVEPNLINDSMYTHITGSLPGATENSILWADGDYANSNGSVRLNGAVIMSTSITFECIFVLDLMTMNNSYNDTSNTSFNEYGRNVLLVTGTSEQYSDNLTDYTSSSEGVERMFSCYDDISIYHLESDEMIGTATNCMYVVEAYTAKTFDDGNSTSMLVVHNSVFTIDYDSMMYEITTQQYLTIATVVYDYADGYTHIVGGPEEYDGSLNVIDADYANVTGRGSVAGAVDMSAVDVNGTVMLNCIVVLELEFDSSAPTPAPIGVIDSGDLAVNNKQLNYLHILSFVCFFAFLFAN